MLYLWLTHLQATGCFEARLETSVNMCKFSLEFLGDKFSQNLVGVTLPKLCRVGRDYCGQSFEGVTFQSAKFEIWIRFKRERMFIMIHMCVYLYISIIYLETVFIYYRQYDALHLALIWFKFARRAQRP